MDRKFNLQERSWILYDVGNSAYSLIISTTIYSLFLNTLGRQAGLSDPQTTSVLGFINSFSFIVIAILSPILGTFADYKGKKKILFLIFAMIGVLSIFSMILVGRGQWIWAAILYNLATLGFAGANIFYNAFLLDVTSKDRLNKVSAAGFAWGYIGSTIPFLISLGVIFALFKDEYGIAMKGFAASFIVTGLWWMFFTLPMVFNVKQKYGLEPSEAPLKDSFKRLWSTLEKIGQHRKVFLFLVAYFLYIDGVDTIIVMAMDFGMKSSFLGEIQLILIILAIQVVAWPCTILYGRLADKIGSYKVLLLGILTYCVITLTAAFMESIPDHWVNGAFIIIAFLVGTAQGGIQAMSRSYFGSLIPKENSAEFFGFFNIFGKFAAILGPFLIGLFSLVMGERLWIIGSLRFNSYSLGVLSLLLFFIFGALVLRKTHRSEVSYA